MKTTETKAAYTPNRNIAIYFCTSPCRVCGANRTWFNIIVRRHTVIARRCLRCEHKEVALKQFPSHLVAATVDGRNQREK